MPMTHTNAALIRGGTSKGLFFNSKDLPSVQEERDAFLLSVMGSPDPSHMQLNGVGGGISSTSKVAIISPSAHPNIDVDYLFGQVSLTEPKIDWEGSCGNLATAVGLYALNSGLVKSNPDGSAKVRVWQVNLGYEIRVNIPPENIPPEDLISIPGVPGLSRPIYVEFIDPSGGESLLPNNQPIHILKLPSGKTIPATLILGANPTIFVRAMDLDLGLSGGELPEEIDFQKLSPIIDHLGQQGADIMGIPYNAAVRLAWVSAPKNNNSNTSASIVSRISTEGRVHHAHTGTGAINLACAARIPGTIPFEIIKDQNKSISIIHPTGIMQVDAKVICNEAGKWIGLSSGFVRTAKIIMKGEVYA